MFQLTMPQDGLSGETDDVAYVVCVCVCDGPCVPSTGMRECTAHCSIVKMDKRRQFPVEQPRGRMLIGPYTTPPRARCVSLEFPTSGRAHTFHLDRSSISCSPKQSASQNNEPVRTARPARRSVKGSSPTADRVTVEWRVVQLEMQGPLARRDILHEQCISTRVKRPCLMPPLPLGFANQVE